MLRPTERGEISKYLLTVLRGAQARAPRLPDPSGVAAWNDDDLQLGLTLCYALTTGGVEGVADEMEDDPIVLDVRRRLESRFASDLRAALPGRGSVGPNPDQVRERILEISNSGDGTFTRFMGRHASIEQFREFLVHRSHYTLREADPHTFVIPRLDGRAKAALVEIQADEYGGGEPSRMHSTMYGQLMRRLGLDPRQGAYVDAIPACTLATVNLIYMFGLHRRWRGAAMGHLALFELTSAIPSRWYANGLRRLGYAEATAYYDEHVEADSVHDQVALHDLVGSLLGAEPNLASDVVFGAEALDYLEAVVARHMIDAWQAGGGSLRNTLQPLPGIPSCRPPRSDRSKSAASAIPVGG